MAGEPSRAAPDDAPVHTILGLPVARPGEAAPRPGRRRRLEHSELLGRYRVESAIGEGGMATVYAGVHTTIHRPVAIKVLDAALDSVPDAVERFLQEARLTSRVVHENVVEVTDFGVTEDGVVFCVMERLQGETLGALIEREGPLPVPRAAAIMRQICGALQAAHEQGIIHRDLKPENCFRAPRTSNSDFIKVLDFGIARVTGQHARDRRGTRPRTQVGCIVGTPEYMAPEQARAEHFDHRIDVYAAGGLFFELLTGRVPYDRGSAAELIAAHLGDPVPDPRELVPSLVPEVCDVVLTAMAKRADDRYADMRELADAIDAAAVAQARGGRRRRSRAPLVALGIAAGAAAIAVATLALHAPTPGQLSAWGPIPRLEPPPVAALAPMTVAPTPAPTIVAAIPPPPPLLAAVDTAAPSRPEPRRTKSRTKPARVVAPPPAEPPPEPTPLRAKLSEVKDPFAD